MRTVLLATFLAAAVAAQSDWIKSNAIPLKTVEAGHGFEDLQPLKKIIGKARIVSLGEATHGTREFFQLKHRMLEFLATEMGFTIFSIEASMPEAYRLNDYVLHGKGEPRALLKGMYFWTWDTEEVLAMIEWMRQFNASGKGRVEFTGFDMQTPQVAGQIVEDFARKHDSEFAPRIAASMKLASAAQYPVPTFGPVTASVDATSLVGKKLKYRGYIKTDNVTGGDVHLWWRADGAGKMLAFRNLGDKSLKGTNDWQQAEIEVDVPAGAQRIFFGGTFSGTGTAWFDSLTLEADGQPIPTPGADLAFEAPTLQGLVAAGNNVYTASLDREVHQAGAQSIRLRRTTPLPAADSGPRAALADWNIVMEHLEASRAKYAEAGAAARDIEWMMQNARVVQQGLQMKSGDVSRDVSMARNVEWILRQSPEAKIVLWAHNGHVGTFGQGSPNPMMGAALRQTYGDQMVVCGFGFHQGSFQAIEPTKGLRNFTVPPAKAGSLDALLAASGPPIFALDLRKAPEELRQDLGSRSIGSMYAEASADRYYAKFKAPEIFDVLLFVENTTAARKTASLQVLEKTAGGALRDPATGLTLRLPEAWTLLDAVRWGQQETTVVLSHKDHAEGTFSLYYAVTAPKEDAAAAIGAKAEQRQREGFEAYKVRPTSIRHHEVNGIPAVTWTADYQRNGQAMTETFTRIRGAKVLAQFFTKAPASLEEKAQAALAPVIASITVP